MPRDHGHNLRIGRHSSAGLIYFVTACCHDRAHVFASPANALILSEELAARDAAPMYDSLAYVVMPDHFHWLVRLKSNVPLGCAVRLVKGRSARRVNRQRGRSGRIWQAGYHDHALRLDEDVESAGQYLIHNPVRAGIVSDVDEYPFWDTVWHRRSGLLQEQLEV